MRLFRKALPPLVLACLLLLAAAPVLAHPLGNFTVNRYSRIQISPQGISVHYVVDMAEIPTIQEKAMLDRSHDGEVSEEERESYLSTRIDRLLRELRLTLDGEPARLHPLSSDIEFLEGQGGLDTLRLTVIFQAEASIEDERRVSLRYEDESFAPRIGWGEVILRADEGVRLLSSTVPETDLSNELRDYPADIPAKLPEVRVAEAVFVLDRALAAGQAPDGAGSWPAGEGPTAGAQSSIATRSASGAAFLPRGEGVAPLLPGGDAGPLGVPVALLLAAVWGAGHAFSPGHGKTVVAAYLVGARGTPRHALYLGLTVTATHTLGVYALGLLTLFAARFVLPEALYPWLSLLASLAVALVGGSLLVGRSRALLSGRSEAHRHDPLHDDQGHGSLHEHGNDAAHHHDHGGGAGHYYHSDHEHDRHDHEHHHGHSHLPPGAQGEGVTWRNLLALGVAGGLVPCPSALVLMLGTIALGQVAFGLALVLSFSLGLAVVLTAIGVAFVYAGRLLLLRRFPGSGLAAPLLRFAPIASALVILLVGLLMAAQAVAETGWLAPR